MSTVELDGVTHNMMTKAATSKVISTKGAVVGRVEKVKEHPRGEFIWLAYVDMGVGDPIQIVFGGRLMLEPGDLVPVAPPGSRVTVDSMDRWAVLRTKKMRIRKYRGRRSHGMLCSLVELGWASEGPDEVALLPDLPIGFELDKVPVGRRMRFVSSTRTQAGELAEAGK